MSKRFIITEEEKNSILRTYLKLNEAPVKGKCTNGDCVNGTGTYVDNEGNTYVGQFMDGKYEGDGELTYVSGDIFKGVFTAGKVYGDGTYTKEDKSSYTGSWIEVPDTNNETFGDINPREDEFVVIYPTDADGGDYKYEGKINLNGLNGEGVFTFPDKTNYSGTFSQENLGFYIPITFNGKDNENNEVSTEDLIKFHDEPNTDVEQTAPPRPKKTPPPPSDNTIGILTAGVINGTTYYEVEVTDGVTSKVEKGILPNTTVEITNLNNKRIFFNTKSDNDGVFSFKDVPHGNYSIVSNINGNNKMTFSSPSFEFNTPTKDIRITLKPSEQFKKYINGDIKKSIEIGQTEDLGDWGNIKYSFIDELYKEPKSSTWISDIINGKFEQKYGTITTKENCVTQLKNYAGLIRDIQSGVISLSITKSVGPQLRPTKKYIQNCWRTYPNDMRKQKSDFLLVRNPGGDVSDYKIVLENANNRDIYNKNNMGLNGTISKIVTDYKLNKDRMIQEEKIIESRFNFVISEGVESIVSLIKEKNELINKGYTGKIIDRVYNRLIKNKF
jgi:hypothetical protein